MSRSQMADARAEELKSGRAEERKFHREIDSANLKFDLYNLIFNMQAKPDKSW